MAKAERRKDRRQDEQRRQKDQQRELQIMQRVGQLADRKRRVRVPEQVLDQKGDGDRCGANRRQDDVLFDRGVRTVVEIQAGGAQQEHWDEERQAGHQEGQRDEDGAQDEAGNSHH